MSERPNHSRRRALCSIALASLLAAGAGWRAPSRAADSTPPDSARYRVPMIEVEADLPDAQSEHRTRVDAAGLRKFLPVATLDALAGLPGVDLVKTGPWSSRPSLRGMSGQRIAVLVDGVPLAPPRGHGAEPSLVSFDDIDAVELTAGASSAEAGSGALGGIIQLVTKRLDFTPGPDLRGQFELRGSEPGDGWYGGGRVILSRSHLAAELTGGGSGLRALVTPDTEIDRSGFREAHGGVRLRAAHRGYDLQLQADRTRAEDVELPAFATPAGGLGRYPFNERRSYRAEMTRAGTRLWPRTSLLAVHQDFDLAFEEQSVESVYVRNRFVGTRAQRTHDDLSSNDETIRLSFEGSRFATWRVEGGWAEADTRGPRASALEVRNREGVVVGTESSHGTAVPPADRSALHVALSASRRVSRLEAKLGLRNERVAVNADSTSPSDPSPLEDVDRAWASSADLALDLGDLTLFARGGSGFRSPNLDERFFDGYIHGALRVFGNERLAPERSRSLDLGASARRWIGGTRLRGRVTAYRNDVRDLISLVYVGQLFLVPRFEYANVTKARLSGVEVELSAERRSVRLALTASRPRGRDRSTDLPLNGVGGDRLGLDVSAELPLGRPTSAALRQRWVGATEAADSLLERPGFDVTSLELSSRLFGSDVTLAVRNLLDRNYRESLSLIDEPARTFALSVRRSFGAASGIPSDKGMAR